MKIKAKAVLNSFCNMMIILKFIDIYINRVNFWSRPAQPMFNRKRPELNIRPDYRPGRISTGTECGTVVTSEYSGEYRRVQNVGPASEVRLQPIWDPALELEFLNEEYVTPKCSSKIPFSKSALTCR